MGTVHVETAAIGRRFYHGTRVNDEIAHRPRRDSQTQATTFGIGSPQNVVP